MSILFSLVLLFMFQVIFFIVRKLAKDICVHLLSDQ